MDAFINLRKQLISEPVMAFPRVDRQYALITDATTGTAEMPGGLGAILTQVDKDGKFYAISFPSQQLKDHENKYLPFLLEAVAPVWGMDHFNEYLKGKKFILYTDHKPLEKLGHFHSKMMNRFQTASLGHNFIIQYKKGSDMPADYLPRLPATTTEPVIAAFDTFEPGGATKVRTICSKKFFTSENTTGARIISPDRKPIIMPTSSKRFSMTKKAFCGYARPITNIPERHYSYLGNIRKKLFAKPTTASSAVTTQT